LLGKWGVLNGTYKLQKFNPAAVWNASWHPNCDQKLTVVMAMKRLDKQNTFTHWNSGMILKADVDKKDKTVTGYWFAYNKYLGGTAVIWRLDGFNLSTNSGGSSLLCSTNTAPVNVNANNILKVISNGPLHRFFLNGKLVCSATDATYIAGAIGQVVAIPRPVTGTQAFSVGKVILTPKAAGASAGEALTAAAGNPMASAPQEVPEGMTPLGVFQ